MLNQMKKLLFALLISLLSSNLIAWEAYEFDVGYIKIVNDSVKIGMTNLGTKQSDDTNICDNPVELLINDITTERGQAMLSLALSAKLSSARMYHQAIAESSSSPCVVHAYQMGIL